MTVPRAMAGRLVVPGQLAGSVHAPRALRADCICKPSRLVYRKAKRQRSHLAFCSNAVAAPETDIRSASDAVSAGSNGASPISQDVINLVAVVPANTVSPLSRNDDEADWVEVFTQVSTRLGFIDERFRLHVFTDVVVKDPTAKADLDRALSTAQILVANGMWGTRVVDLLANHPLLPETHLFLDSAPRLKARTVMGGVRIGLPGVRDKVASTLPWTSTKRAITLWQTVEKFYYRYESDDLLFMFLVLIDAYITPVPWVQRLRATGLGSIACMARKCGRQVLACVRDPECKACLDCLEGCAPNDQVCSYRCIVSHETPKLQDFTLCILQRHNCLGLAAPIPSQPAVSPMAAWRGSPLTHAAAEDIFIGWLGDKQYSWRVVAGQNAAYDQFSCQYQLYYRGKAKGTLWYDPVFQVRTLSGEKVWRRRHYRVRRGKVPGTFHFSVLDNGVISSEFWRIVDATDDLSWALFFYAGAASAAGQAYTGAVLATPDGAWPDSSQKERLRAALAKSSIKQWEMFQVDNSCCENAPLDLPGASSSPGTSLRELATSGALDPR